MTEPRVVHILAYGAPLCSRVRGVPAEWPPGHVWISFLDDDWRRDATCTECRARAEARKP